MTHGLSRTLEHPGHDVQQALVVHDLQARAGLVERSAVDGRRPLLGRACRVCTHALLEYGAADVRPETAGPAGQRSNPLCRVLCDL